MIPSKRSNDLKQNVDQANLLHRIIQKIRKSLNLEEILTTTANEIRAYLNTDRVKIYRFAADGSGEVVAESIQEQRLPSLLGLHFPSGDIPLAAREMFLSAQQRSIVDVSGGKIGLSPLLSKETSEQRTDHIQYRQVDPCHIQYLKSMGVDSSLVVPILYYDLREHLTQQKLWGLLVSHHSQPRTILKRELRLVQYIADQVAIAISQSNLLEETRAQQKREAIINQVCTFLHQLPSIQIQPALSTIVNAFEGIGGRIYMRCQGRAEPSPRETYTWGTQIELSNELEINELEELPILQEWLQNCQPGKVLAVTDIYQEMWLRELVIAAQPTKIRGLMMIPLHYHTNFLGVISIYRPEFDAEILWAGRCDQNQRQDLPRLSFNTWREARIGQALEWKPEEISCAQTLGYHFSMAIQQYQTHLQLQQVNSYLSSQIQEQTIELEQSLLLAQVLKQVTDQIRSTLNLDTILKTIVREVRPLLNSDRVVIYQFYDDSRGEVTMEEVSGNWPSVLGVSESIGCFPDQQDLPYLKARFTAISDILTETISPCHRNFLQSIQVRANLVVPIQIGDQLWGLLIAHQCGSPRNWQDAEINLLQQLADKAAIAIQQAQLYEQSCAAEAEAINKAQQLEHTLNQLQQTQAQLIHTEKMSGLGQLVAGIAHEINNPVSFIYGNLTHASEYIEQLLELLQLYQLYYPNPDPVIRSTLEAIDIDFLMQDLPKVITSMSVGANRIRSIVLSLRNFSRLDESEDKSVDLHEGINNTLLILQHRLKPNGHFSGIEVIKDYGILPNIICYAGHINQVFMNIINNAIDILREDIENTDSIHKNEHFSQKTPTIKITTRVSIDNSHIIIKIADNGSGMPEQVKKRIFDPFFTTKPVGKGTGLGLAISYQIVVEKHKGMMGCISEPGNGTEFWIEIPLKKE